MYSYLYILKNGKMLETTKDPSVAHKKMCEKGLLKIIQFGGMATILKYDRENFWISVEYCKKIILEKDGSEIDLGQPIRKKDSGLHLELKEFVRQCKEGSFVNSDGSGYYASACRRFKKEIRPSEAVIGQQDKRFTHVLWYNK